MSKEIWRRVITQQQKQQQQISQQRILTEQLNKEKEDQKRREWLQKNRIHEAISPSSASSAAGAGGGSGNKRFPTFLGFDNNYQLYYLYIDREPVLATQQPFTGNTTLSNDPDDNDFIYFVTLDNESDTTFGKLNKSTLERIDLDTSNLRLYTSLEPNSLDYLGSNAGYNGNFLYVDNILDIRISTFYDVSSDGQSVSILGTYSNDTNFIMGTFQYKNQFYLCSVVEGFLGELYSLDLDTFTTTYIDTFTINVNTLPIGISPTTKVVYILDFVVYADKIYCSVLFFDKSDGSPHGCIGELNISDATINYVFGLDTILAGGGYFTSIATL